MGTRNGDGASKGGSERFSLGLAFLLVGVGVGVGTKNLAVGLPFLVLGVVFMVTGRGKTDDDAQ